MTRVGKKVPTPWDWSLNNPSIAKISAYKTCRSPHDQTSVGVLRELQLQTLKRFDGVRRVAGLALGKHGFTTWSAVKTNLKQCTTTRLSCFFCIDGTRERDISASITEICNKGELMLWCCSCKCETGGNTCLLVSQKLSLSSAFAGFSCLCCLSTAGLRKWPVRLLDLVQKVWIMLNYCSSKIWLSPNNFCSNFINGPSQKLYLLLSGCIHTFMPLSDRQRDAKSPLKNMHRQQKLSECIGPYNL